MPLKRLLSFKCLSQYCEPGLPSHVWKKYCQTYYTHHWGSIYRYLPLWLSPIQIWQQPCYHFKQHWILQKCPDEVINKLLFYHLCDSYHFFWSQAIKDKAGGIFNFSDCQQIMKRAKPAMHQSISILIDFPTLPVALCPKHIHRYWTYNCLKTGHKYVASFLKAMLILM